MPGTVFRYADPSVLNVQETTSRKRALYLENRASTPIVFEMQNEQAWSCFNALPAHVLPPLPSGYTWTRAKNHYAAMRHVLAQEHDIEIVLYGPNQKKEINFLCCIDGVTTYSLAHTKREKQMRRRYPMSSKDFRVLGYDYSKKTFPRHIRGHDIDHQDTIPEGKYSSTYDARNFTPEPPSEEWGQWFRSSKVCEIRRQPNGGVYVQMNSYWPTTLKTKNNTFVPDNVRFLNLSRSYMPKEVFHVQFEEDLTALNYAEQDFLSTLQTMPVVVPYTPELSDNELRHKLRHKEKVARGISQGFFKPRFPQDDRLQAISAAADFEFETAGQQLHAGIFSSVAKMTSAPTFFNRSRKLAEELLTIDDKPPFTNEDARDGLRFFARDINGQYDDDFDHFLRLWSSA